MKMNAINVIFFCLICAIFANPIIVDTTLDSLEKDTNSTETFLVAQSLGNGTSDSQSSESESSESVESESSDTTSEESDSVESNETELLVETRDDSMGSEENVRKSWLRVFATVVRDTSVEDNSTEAKDQTEILNNKLTVKQTIQPPTVKTLKQSSNAKVALVQKATVQSDSSSESAESTDNTAPVTFTADSSQSASSESNETSSEASDSASDSAQSSSSEDSSNSDSRELTPIKDCVNGTQSCESQEYFFQDIGDDANYSVDNLMVPDEDDRELSLRR